MCTLTNELTQRLKGFLEKFWETFEILHECGESYNDHGMSREKLNRIEEITWNRPELKFIIERHGEICLGSSRATVQHWTVDLSTGTAQCTKKGSRQIHPRHPKKYVKTLANNVATAIKNRKIKMD